MLETIAAEARTWAPMETGGCFAGYYASGTAEVVITHTIGPGPKARHAEGKFVPDRKYHDKELEKLWKSSGRTVRYIGDWHSHPGGPSELSYVDREFMRHALKTRDAFLAYALVGLVYGELKAARFWYLTRGRFGFRGDLANVEYLSY